MTDFTPPGIGNGYGIAKDTVCVDFDGTIIKWSGLDDTDPELQPGVVDAMKALQAKGKRILIFTSRMSHRWLVYEGRTAYDQYHHIGDILRKHDIPFHDIIGEKVPAEAYIDDMAVGFRGDWGAVLAELGMDSESIVEAKAKALGLVWTISEDLRTNDHLCEKHGVVHRRVPCFIWDQTEPTAA